MTRRIRTLVAAVLLAAGAAGAGCDQTAWVLSKALAPWIPEDEVKAEFGLQGKSVLVLVDTGDPSLRSEYPQLESELAARLGKALKNKNAAGPIVPAQSVEAARQMEPDFAQWSVVQAGKHFNVDLVLHVRVFEFRLKDNPGSSIMGSYSEGAISLISTDSGEQVWPVLRSARLVTVETTPDFQPESPGEMQDVLLDGLADKIARHFYTYKVGDLPMRPKVK